MPEGAIPENVVKRGENNEPRHGRRVAAAAGQGAGEAAVKGGKGGKGKDDESDDGNIPEIPDIDGGGVDSDEDITRKVAEAPKVRKNQVLTLDELEKNTPVSMKGNREINLGLLSSVLAPQDQLEERDVEWTFEGLLAEVSSAFNSASEKKSTQAPTLGKVSSS